MSGLGELPKPGGRCEDIPGNSGCGPPGLNLPSPNGPPMLPGGKGNGGKSLISAALICSAVNSVGSPVCVLICC